MNSLRLVDDVIHTDDLSNQFTRRPVKDDSSISDRMPYYDPDIPASRNVPLDAKFHQATVDRVIPILVCTGVYRPPARKSSNRDSDDEAVTGSSSEEDGEDDVKKVPYHGHRDFPNSAELYKPSRLCDDVCAAVEYILQVEAYD
jgi:hypothetical protein